MKEPIKVPINQTVLLQNSADFLDFIGMSDPSFLGLESEPHYEKKLEYLRVKVNELEDNKGVCRGACLLKLRCELISRYQGETKDIKMDLVIHNNEWFKKTRLHLAQWTVNNDHTYTNIQRSDILFFIDQLILGQDPRKYLYDSKTDLGDIDVLLPVLTKGKELPKLRTLGKIFGFYNTNTLTKILNLILKENRFILIGSHNHEGLLFINNQNKIEFFDINKNEEDIICQDTNEIVFRFSQFPGLNSAALPVKIYAYTISEVDLSFPRVNEVAALCENKKITYCPEIPGYLGGICSLNLLLNSLIDDSFRYFIDYIESGCGKNAAAVITMNYIRNSQTQLLKLKSSDPTIDLNEQDPFGKNVLMHAIISKNYSLVEFLLTQSLELNSQDRFGWTVLMYAALQSNGNIFSQLIKAGCDPLIKDKQGKSAISHAIEAKNKVIIEEILKFRGQGQISLLMYAIIQHDLATIGLLADFKSDINYKDKANRTALCYAAANGLFDIVKLLLLNGADPSIADSMGKTAKICAQEYKHDNIAQYLESQTPRFYMPTKQTALQGSTSTSVIETTSLQS